MSLAVQLSPVETAALKKSIYSTWYPPAEKIPTIIVDNFPALGRLAAMRFLEWAQENPEGVISLPTGKTPEHFIAWVKRVLTTWDQKDTKAILESDGINASKKIDLRGIYFAQIDDFYPIHSTQENSFFHYVNKFYLQGFGMDPKRALLMECDKIGMKPGQKMDEVWPDGTCDLSLRTRQPRTVLERTQQDALHRIDQWCQEYEERLRKLGGIGFFLGGIGPDGHIGFNVRGSDHLSTTRLCETNYETQAAAASDLGGVEVSRKRLVITIGLGTIAYNPKATAIIMAAGEAKAKLVSQAVESPKDVLYPATSLQGLVNARFYITAGAAKLMGERQFVQLTQTKSADDTVVEKIVVDLAVGKRKRLIDLKADDFKSCRFAAELLKKRNESAETLAKLVHTRIVGKIEAGSKTELNKRFLHSEPHHDDIMLGYLPNVVRNVRSATNEHYFATLTSGFTAVTNHFLHRQLSQAKAFLSSPACTKLDSEGYFAAENRKGRNRDLWQYLDGVAAMSSDLRKEGEARRCLRNLTELFGTKKVSELASKIDELEKYLGSVYPGKKDPPEIQKLKGMCREWEAECLWGYFGWSSDNVYHLRLGFYTGDLFTQEPTMERDMPPVLDLLEKTKPDIVSVALDPEASGPDTHYKVMQATSAGLTAYSEKSGRKDIKVWGYRNVWFRFHPSEANLFIPVSLNMFSVMESSFLNTFISQKEASFPSYEHDGPFCELAQRIQVEQYEKIKICLGREWFHEHPSPLIRATRGLVFLSELTLDEFYSFSRQLRKAAENR
jgi:glucosamine-6-phosphate deaminase